MDRNEAGATGAPAPAPTPARCGWLLRGASCWALLALLVVLPAAHAEEPARLHGTFRYDDGTPVGNASMAVITEYICTQTRCTLDEDQRLDLETDSGGRWSATVPPGGILVVGWAGFSDQVQETLTVRPGEEREVPLVFLRTEPSVTVRVHALDAVDGTPVNASVFVDYRGEQGLHQVYETTTTPGVIRIEVVADRFEHVECGEVPRQHPDAPQGTRLCEQQVNGHLYHTWRLLVPASAGDHLEVEAHLTRLPPPGEVQATHGQVAGWVIDPATGRGVPDALVAAYQEATLEWGHARTDEHGAYRMNVTAGHLLLQAAAVGPLQGLRSVDVPADGVAHADIELLPSSSGVCCWRQPEAYPIPAEGPAPAPPEWTPSPMDPEEDGSFRNGFDLDSDEMAFHFWKQTFAATEAGLGPHDATADLASGPSGSVATSTLPVGLASVALAVAAWTRRR